MKADIKLAMVHASIIQRLGDYRERVRVLDTGYFLDTSDPQERECVRRELKAAIAELEYLDRLCRGE